MSNYKPYALVKGAWVTPVEGQIEEGNLGDGFTFGKPYQVKCVEQAFERPFALVYVADNHGVVMGWHARRFERWDGPVPGSAPEPEPEPVKPVKSEMQYATDSASRKGRPVERGCLRYFPAALELVSVLSRKGNEKHNPGEPMHHARGKSTDHGDCIVRHQAEAGTIDPDTGLDHAVAVAWRALAQLQELAESKYGWPMAPGAKK